MNQVHVDKSPLQIDTSYEDVFEFRPNKVSSIKKQKSEFDFRINTIFEDSLIESSSKNQVIVSGQAKGLFDDQNLEVQLNQVTPKVSKILPFNSINS